MLLLQIILICLFPYLAKRLHQASGQKGYASPVLLCYAIGIVLANVGLTWDKNLNHLFQEGTIVLGIPLLLLSTDLVGWFRFAKGTIISFGLIVLSVLLVTVGLGVSGEWVSNQAVISGSFVGLYTGGIPNMSAVGLALGAPEELIVAMTTADVVVGGIFLVFLMSIAKGVYGLLLPKFKSVAQTTTMQTIEKSWSWVDYIKGLGVGLLAVGLAVGVTMGITGELKNVSLLLLLLTSFSVLASLSKQVRSWNGTFESGEYLLLMFCVAIGLEADFGAIMSESFEVMIYMAVTLSLVALLHLLFCKVFKIDTDTAIITATAALYGPVFIGQVASAIDNKDLIFSGMATGLVGYAVGNYLGVLVGSLL